MSQDCTETSRAEDGTNLFRQVKGTFFDFWAHHVEDDKRYRQAQKTHEAEMSRWQASWAEYRKLTEEHKSKRQRGGKKPKAVPRVTNPSEAPPQIEESHLRPLNLLDMPITTDVWNT